MPLYPSIVRALAISSVAAIAALAALLPVPARARDAAALERGRYLVTTIMACGNCHTPKDAQGRPVAGKELSGGGVAIDVPPFTVVAPNITPDRDTGIGTWSDAEIRRAITHGERPQRSALAGKPIAVMAIGFFKALPDELEEAALIDGAGRITAFWRVLLPLAAPGLVASAIFAFTLSWNEFLYALVFIQDEQSITVPVGLNLLIYGDVFHWGQLMAASVITTIPVVALYVFIHRWMVEGLVAGGVKG